MLHYVQATRGMNGLVAALIVATISATSRVQAAVLHVCPDGSCGYQSIQHAIEDAQNGDTIEISAGTYPISFALNTRGKSIRINGELGKDGRPSVVLDGLGMSRILECTSGEGPQTELSRLRFTRGGPNPNFGCRGSGVLIMNASPTLESCMFDQCNAGTYAGCGGDGGAAHLLSSSSRFHGCTFIGNRATYGGAACIRGGSPRFEACTFVNNTAPGYEGYPGFGGAIIITQQASVTLTSCVVSQNHASNSGGVRVESASLTAVGCEFTNNTGGGIRTHASACDFQSCSFVGNTALEGGGLMFGSGTTELTDCQIEGNIATAGSGGGIMFSSTQATLIRCALLANVATGFMYSQGGGFVVTPNNGTSTIDLAGTTVCGNNSVYLSMTSGNWNDLGGNCLGHTCDFADVDRDGTEDLCEHWRGDANLDGRIDGADLATLLVQWGQWRPSFGDFNSDDVLNASDLAILISRWGDV